jgi:hypothetical protein
VGTCLGTYVLGCNESFSQCYICNNKIHRKFMPAARACAGTNGWHKISCEFCECSLAVGCTVVLQCDRIAVQPGRVINQPGATGGH